MKKPVALAIIAAGGGLGAAAMSRVPMTMLEWAIASTGFSEILPALAPPLGKTAQLSLCGAAALLAMACVAALLPSSHSSPHEKKMIMASVFSRLAHFARGNSMAVAGADDAPRLRRADAHPDAPPRAPLSVVRDLGEKLDSAAPVAVRMPGVAPFEPPVSADLPDSRPAFVPPEDMLPVEGAEEAVASVMDVPEAVIEPAAEPVVFAPAPLPVPVAEPLGLVPVEDGEAELAALSISQLIDRLEAGLNRLQQDAVKAAVPSESRIADFAKLDAVDDAGVSAGESVPMVERRPFGEPVMVAGQDVRDREIEGTLQSALAALRGMNAKAV